MPQRIFSRSINQNNVVASELESHELIDFKESAKKLLELSFFKALGSFFEPEIYPMTTSEDSIERLIYDRISSLTPERKILAKASLDKEKIRMTMITPTYYSDIEELGILSALQTDESIFDKGDSYLSNKGLAIKREIEAAHIQPMQLFGATSLTGSRIWADNFKVKIQLDTLTCDKLTSGAGSDEIAISSVYVNSKGDSTKIAPYTVSSNFNLNDIVSFPPKDYILWDLLQVNNSYPKTCICTFILAELDNGGLPDLVDKLYNKLKDKLKELIMKLGDYVGDYLPVLGPAIAVVVAEVVGWLLDLLFGWFKEIWEDDIFPPVTVQLDIPNEDYRFNNGGERLSYNICQFEGHGGKYTLNYTWQLERTYMQQDGSWTPHAKDPNRGATIFSLMEYNGISKFLKMGKYSLIAKNRLRRFGTTEEYDFDSGAFFKKVNSIKINPDVSVQLFKTPDFSGGHLTIAWDSPLIGENDSSWWNAVGSIIIGDISMYQNEMIR